MRWPWRRSELLVRVSVNVAGTLTLSGKIDHPVGITPSVAHAAGMRELATILPPSSLQVGRGDVVEVRVWRR